MNTYKWKTINDVPKLIVEWAQIVADEPNITITDIIDLVASYEEWIDTIQTHEDII